MVSTSLNQLSSRELSVRVASRREVETRQQKYFFMRNHLSWLRSHFLFLYQVDLQQLLAKIDAVRAKLCSWRRFAMSKTVTRWRSLS
ncbi:hypothetical protein [Nostoc sp.]|uniref:hypothetical protein n=1 Tax=Nostoc sp. TaxID=1180 RepID=UPI002FFB8D21